MNGQEGRQPEGEPQVATLIKDVIRDRSRDVAQGRIYNEVGDRQTSRLLEVQLNLVSNDPAANAEFGKLDADYSRPGQTYRSVLLDKNGELAWESGALVSAISEKARVRYGTAVGLAAEILKNL